MAVESLIDRKNWDEHYVKKGDPSKPTYYICRRGSTTVGLFGRYNLIAGQIIYAQSKGWIPVVDMQNYPNPYLPPEKLGKENAWEYYFEQPMRIGLKEAYSGENIVLSSNEVKPYPTHKVEFLSNKNNALTKWHMLIKKGLLAVKPELMKEILQTKERLFSPDDKVLGVILRGTDYILRQLEGHPIPPSVELAESTIADKIKEWNCNKFFLATEDKSIIERLKNRFGDQCIIFDRVYVDYNPKTDKSVAYSRISRENDHYQQGKDYLTQIILVSMCNSLVAARCGATKSAVILADKFEHTYFFDLGRYGEIRN
ncbi:MAG: hypothetical protein IKT98_01660 [Selenomonadaceae bacterium]|nr:hypothetical protein [Selenomonadaceae bacterium]